MCPEWVKAFREEILRKAAKHAVQAGATFEPEPVKLGRLWVLAVPNAALEGEKMVAVEAEGGRLRYPFAVEADEIVRRCGAVEKALAYLRDEPVHGNAVARLLAILEGTK